MTDAEIIQLERQIEADTEATQIRLNSQYCPTCGTRKIRGKCEYCDPDAEKQRQAENSSFYAKNIPPHTQIWRCEGCSFTGSFQDFCDESDRQSSSQFVKDFSMDEVAEIPY